MGEIERLSESISLHFAPGGISLPSSIDTKHVLQNLTFYFLRDNARSSHSNLYIMSNICTQPIEREEQSL